jgi:hypothetical protein
MIRTTPGCCRVDGSELFQLQLGERDGLLKQPVLLVMNIFIFNALRISYLVDS